ncbi:hypothetical protein [Duffyella gerundensis]|uniref:hypothetical protein n=1 Tax=Duffyella gerundensis TaxID=1619313 RepID=UPI00165428E2|nr:hypothetical protein [Duffyella gerundensis]
MQEKILDQEEPIFHGKTAIILHGLFRTALNTATSFNKNVSDYLDADVFYCGYKYSDKPLPTHGGEYDKFGFMKKNPKNTTEIDSSNEITDKILNEVYGDRLKSSYLHETKSEDLMEMLAGIDNSQILFQLIPSRFLSMFHNIENGYKLVTKFEEKNKFKYDNIVIARPDLAFYSALDLEKLKKGTMLIPSGMGFHPHTGTRNYGLVEPLYYKNVNNGTCIPTGMHFNDQLMALKRIDCFILNELLTDCVNYMKMKVPFTPETILYYHFSAMHRLKVLPTEKWLYEIFRVGAPQVENITDLPLLERFDPHHPIVKDRARKSRFKYYLKDVRRNFYFYKNKIKTLIQG